MANTNAPFGFRPIRDGSGGAWAGKMSQLKVANGDSAALNRGDVVKQLATGYVTVAAAGITDHSVRGVFMGCHYLSSALGYPIWSNYWPGSGATGDVDVFVVDDPFVVFEVQGSTSTAIAFADIGANGDVSVTASTTGFSNWRLNQATLAATATFPFRIIGLGNGGVNVGNGYDTSTGFNIVEVQFNDMFLKQATGLL